MTTDSDEARIHAAQKNPSAFHDLYDAYYDRIYRYVLSKVNHQRFVADDITSRTFEQALTHISSFQWQGISFAAYLYRIANNTIIDYYRVETKKKNTTEVHENNSDTHTSIEDRVLASDSAYRIEKAIAELSERERTIVRLKFYEGYTNTKIAEIIGISESNVGTILYRAMKKLQKPLTPLVHLKVEHT